MTKFYANSPADGLVPLNGESLMEAIKDASGRAWKFTEGSVPILNGDARPVAWVDPDDHSWTLSPPVRWWAGSIVEEAEAVPLQH